MERLRGAFFVSFLLSSALLPGLAAQSQEPGSPVSSRQSSPAQSPSVQTQNPEAAPAGPQPNTQAEKPAANETAAHSAAHPTPPISSNAPRMSKQTRYEIIRDFETQIFYARTAFPMGTKGLLLKNGVTIPNGTELQQALALWGPAVKPGDPAHISYVSIKDNHIHFDINGGPVHRKKWYQRVEISGTSGTPVSTGPTESPTNPHGTYLDIYFDKYVPEMSAAQLRNLLFPVLDFTAHNKEEAYLDTLPPKVKEAIKKHYVLVGMNSEMVLHAKGKPPRKVREKDGETDYEEWIYGDPPRDVDFVRIVGDEVVRVETVKVGGEKIVRTQKEVILESPDKQAEAKKEEQDRPANAPSLRRPGEDAEDAPRPANGASPVPITPQTGPQPGPQPGPGGNGPGSYVAQR